MKWSVLSRAGEVNLLVYANAHGECEARIKIERYEREIAWTNSGAGVRPRRDPHRFEKGLGALRECDAKGHRPRGTARGRCRQLRWFRSARFDQPGARRFAGFPTIAGCAQIFPFPL